MAARVSVRARLLTLGLTAVLVGQLGYVPPAAEAAEPTATSAPSAPPSPEPAPETPTTSPSTPTEPAEGAAFDPTAEVVERRTETSHTSDNGDGTMTTEVFPEPIHYKPEAEAAWQPIDLTFAPSSAKEGARAVTKSPVKVTVAPASEPTGFLTLDLDGVQISLRPLVPSTSDTVPTTTGSKAIVADVLPGVDVQVFASAEGVNLFLILEQAPANPTFTFVVDAPGLDLALDKTTKRLLFKSLANEVVASLRMPYAVDSTVDPLSGGGRMTTDVSYSLGKAGGLTTVTVAVDPVWLAGATYPVYIDPTIYNDGGTTYGDAHVNQGNPGFNYGNYKRPDAPGYYEMWLGETPGTPSYYSEAYLKFDLAQMAGQTIDSASLKVRPYHQYYDAPTATTTWLHRVHNDYPWAENTITWNNKPAVVSTYVTDGLVENQDSNFDITYWVQSWLDGTNPNNGLRLDENGNGPTYWKRLIAAEEGTTTRPRIVFTSHVPTATPTTPTGPRNSRTLAWSYSDPAGHPQSHYEVEVDNSSGFTSPLTHDGPVTSGTATTYAIPGTVSLTNGTTYYWRVRVKDGTSWSAWASSSFVWDAAAPGAPTNLDLTSASDTGSSATDNITNDQTPTITGDAEPGASVTLYSSSTPIGTGTANGSGDWTITATTTLSAGVKSITAKATDAAGNESPASSVLSMTVDVTPPAVPSTPDLTAGSDTGTSSTDNITTDTTPTFTGTAEVGATVTVYANGGAVGTGTASGGNWSITTSTLAPIVQSITAKATDIAGNQNTTPSGALSVTVVSAPQAPSTPDLAASSDTGVSPTDNVTMDTTPTFTGTAASGASVALLVDGLQVGSGTATGGNWTITASALGAGNRSVSARVTVSGHDATSSVLAVTIDPNQPTGSLLISGGAATTDVPGVTLTFTASDTHSSVASVEASNDGSVFTAVGASPVAWNLVDGSGTRTVSLRIRDIAGNEVTVSDSIELLGCGSATYLPDYQAYCWKYSQVAHGGSPGFQAQTFDDSSWPDGQGAFGSGGGCPLQQNGSVHTNWSTNTDLLLRRHISLEPGTAGVAVLVSVDNDVQEIYWNGVSLGPRSEHEGCSNLDDRFFVVEPALVEANNVLAIRARDRGSQAYFDAQVVTGFIPPEPAPDGAVARDNSGRTGDPVETFSGAFTYTMADISSAGRGPTPVFTRSYNSADARVGPMGPGWTHSYSTRLRDSGDGSGDLLFVRPDGHTDRFVRTSLETFNPSPATYATLERHADLSYTVTERNQLQWSFDQAGNLVAITDRHGNVSELGYDTSGQLVSVSDPAGRGSLTLGYVNGRLTSVTDWLAPARTVAYTYDAQGRLETVTDRTGATTTFTYDGTSHRLATITDARGHVALTMTYDPDGRVATQKDARGLVTGDTTTFAYVVNGDGTRVTTTTSPPTSFEPSFSPTIVDAYTPQGWLTQRVSRPSSVETLTESYTYDAIGNRTSVTDPRGNRTDFCHDVNYAGGAVSGSRGNLTRIIGPAQIAGASRPVTLMAYDGTNNLLQAVAPKGVPSGTTVTCATNLSAIDTTYATDNTYDASGAVLVSTTSRFTDPDSGLKTATTKYEYGDAANPGLVTRIIPARGNIAATPDYAYATTYAYFGSGIRAGMLERITNPLGNATTFDYDAVGRMTSSVDPLGNAAGGVAADHRTEFVYDGEDRIRFTKLPAPTAGGSQLVAETRHDEVGNPIVRIDANGQVTTYAYDERDGLAQVTESPAVWVDPASPPSQIVLTTYAYDAAGHLTRMTRAAGDSANERVTDYVYDGRGLARRETQYPAWPSTSGSLITTTTYDPTGNVSTVLDPLGRTTSYGYDPLNRLGSIGYSDPGTPDVDYEYDANGNRTSMVDGTGTTTYAYDEVNRLTSVSSPGSTVVGYRYDLDGNRTKLIYPDGTAVTYAYDEAGRLEGMTDWASRTLAYTYFADGTIETATNPNGTVTTYAYDNARRATAINHALGGTSFASHAYGLDNTGNVTALDEGANDWTYAYDRLYRLTDVAGPDGARTCAYDPAGNRRSKVLGSTMTTYSYDRADRITAAGSSSITVDAAGNTTAKGSDTFEYDGANRLVEAMVAGATETYTYDGDGVRASRQVGTGPVTPYVSDVNAALPVTIAEGSHKYVWGAGLAYAVNGSNLEVFHADRLGSVRAITDASGTVIATYRTDEFGIETAMTGTSDPPFGFTGELADATGLSYLRARHYDPGLARFLTRDTWPGATDLSQSLNRYAYVGSNPATFADPSGHFFPLIAAAVAWVATNAVPIGTAVLWGTAGVLGAAAVGTAVGQATQPIFNDIAQATRDQRIDKPIPPPSLPWNTVTRDWTPHIELPDQDAFPGPPLRPPGPGRRVGLKALITGLITISMIVKSSVLTAK